MSDYGGITVTGHYRRSGRLKRITFGDTPQRIGISLAVLETADGRFLKELPNGDIQLRGWRFGRRLTYRPVRFDQDGRVIVCERVT